MPKNFPSSGQQPQSTTNGCIPLLIPLVLVIVLVVLILAGYIAWAGSRARYGQKRDSYGACFSIQDRTLHICRVSAFDGKLTVDMHN